MKRFRRLVRQVLIGLITSALVLTGGLASTASDAWTPTASDVGANYESFLEAQKNGFHNLLIGEVDSLSNSFGNYRTGNWQQKQTPENYKECFDPGPRFDCGSGTSGRYVGSAVLPVCGEVIESCIEKVWIYESGQQPQEATFSRSLEGQRTKGYPSEGIPRGSTPSVWKSTKQHSAGDEYTANANVSFGIYKGEVYIESLTFTVVPTQEISYPGAAPAKYEVCTGPYRVDEVGDCGMGMNFTTNCVYGQTEICGTRKEFSENTRVGIQLKLHNSITGWFHGRVQRPDLQVTQINSQYNRVKVDAAPVKVSRFFTQSRPDLGDKNPTQVIGNIGYGGSYTIVGSTMPDAFNVLRNYRNRAQDTAAGVSTIWSVSTMAAQQAAQNGSQCLADRTRILGIVTTNATAYSGGAPVFRRGFLSYEVAGMHYLPGGTELAQGSYDLVMRSDVARCLYGFANAPISATVSVVNNKGQKTTATTIVSEKNGWLKMAAYGFSYSNKTIRVKVTKAKPTTITCVSNVDSTKTKKVKAINPKCPKGFKKK